MRSASHAPQPAGWEAPTGGRSRWAPLALAVLTTVAVAGALVLAFADRGGDGLLVEADPTPPAPAPTPEPGPALAWSRHAAAAGTWASLPQAPLGPRVDPVVVWTGKGVGYAPRARGEIVVWGGHRGGHDGLADGAAYDPFRGAWRRIAEAPHAWTSGSTVAATWTGAELITLVAPGGGRPVLGVAYDPEADRWRETARPPANLAFWQAAGWTGREVVVLAFARDLRTHRAVAYDPQADRWRRIPPARVLADEGVLLAAALPGGLAVFGEARGHPAATLLAPDAAGWTDPDVLPASAGDVARPLQGATAVDVTTGRLLLAGVTQDDRSTRRTWAWSPADGWERLPDLRTDSPSGRTQLAWGGGRLLAWLGAGTQAGAVLDPADDDGWRPMAPPPLSPRHGAGTAWTGRALFVWGGSHEGEVFDDGAVFLPWTGLSDGRLRTGP